MWPNCLLNWHPAHRQLLHTLTRGFEVIRRKGGCPAPQCCQARRAAPWCGPLLILERPEHQSGHLGFGIQPKVWLLPHKEYGCFYRTCHELKLLYTSCVLQLAAYCLILNGHSFPIGPHEVVVVYTVSALPAAAGDQGPGCRHLDDCLSTFTARRWLTGHSRPIPRNRQGSK